MGQSSNDVIPTAIHVAAYVDVAEQLLPSLQYLHETLETKADSVDHVVTTGRTHLMDAMPIRLSQELRGWASQMAHGIDRVNASLPRLAELAQGATAVGTGINAHPGVWRPHRSQAGGNVRAAVRDEQQLLREPERSRRGGGTERATEDRGRQPDEDRQRLALDE